MQKEQPTMKINSFLKLVAIFFLLNIYLIACGSNSTSVTSINHTPTSNPSQSPTSNPNQSSASNPNVTPTPTFSPDDPGVQAIPQPVPASDCTVEGNFWSCIITLQYKDSNDSRSIPWSVIAHNLPGATFTPPNDTLTPNGGNTTTAHIPHSDCHDVSDSFVFAFTTTNERLKATTSWSCSPEPTPAPTDTPVPTPIVTPIPTPMDTPTPIQ